MRARPENSPPERSGDPDGVLLMEAEQLGTVDDAAAAVAFLARDDAAFVSGQVISVNDGSSMG